MVAQPDDPVADLEVVLVRVRAEGHDCPGCLAAEDLGLRGGVEARAEVGIDEVDAGDGVLDEDLAFLQRGDGVVGAVLEDFGAADVLDHDSPLC